METRSNHVLVGGVVLLLLALLALFTVWIARLGGAAEKEYDIFFPTSVDGLARGSGVTFAGVPIGQVDECMSLAPGETVSTMGRRAAVVREELVPIGLAHAARFSWESTGAAMLAALEERR